MKSGFGIYDPTTIMNAQILNLAQREGWIKLGFYMVTFFYYLYCYSTKTVLGFVFISAKL